MITKQDFIKTLIRKDSPKTLDDSDKMKLCEHKEFVKCMYLRKNGRCAKPEKCAHQIERGDKI